MPSACIPHPPSLRGFIYALTWTTQAAVVTSILEVASSPETLAACIPGWFAGEEGEEIESK